MSKTFNKNDALEFMIKYVRGIKASQEEFLTSIKTATDEMYLDSTQIVKYLFNDPINVPPKFLFLLKDLVGSGLWISYTYLRYLKAFYLVDRFKSDHLEDPLHLSIVDSINQKKPILNRNIDIPHIFVSVFEEIHQSFKDLTYKSKVNIPKFPYTLALVSGVFNELFKTHAFERGCLHLEQDYGIKIIKINTSGIKSSKQNALMIEHQVKDYLKNNPDEKLWFVGYSKGGLDVLHFLKNNYELSNDYIFGLSTIASPIVGSEHTNHKLVQLIDKISDLKLYNKFDQGKDLLGKEFQRSLSSKYQGVWFRKNYHQLPRNLLYSSIALKSDLGNSHFWMMLTKLFFNSRKINDGVVDAEAAKFPDYFHAFDFGILNGHHLSGTRSSSFSQEALLLAHIVVLDYLNHFNKK
jgi:hypothetical protein